jgi:hypothetical protein
MGDQALFTLESITETKFDTVESLDETKMTSVAAAETNHTVESITPASE